MSDHGTLAVIQARMSSSRLPGKSLMDLSGKPLLQRVIEQVIAATEIDYTVVATSTSSVDDAIAVLCHELSIPVVRGHETDVLSRYVLALNVQPADTIVRVTGDCPLITPDTIDEVVNAYRASTLDYMSNTAPYSRPEGLDVEVFSSRVLLMAHALAEKSYDREHVTPWIKRCPDIKKSNFRHRECDLADEHWSVDHAADLNFARRLWARLVSSGPGPYTYWQILASLAERNDVNRSEFLNEGYFFSILADCTGEPATPLNLTKSERLLARSEAVIPGGSQTYSKSWRHHIRGVTPIFLQSGKGASVWDVDGNEYVDLIQGLLPNILGYANDEVDAAVIAGLRDGINFSLPHPVEIQLAERLVGLIPSAEMVRFGKNGSDATSGAVRVARAFTGRDRIAACGYHGWHDWFIGTTSRSRGVPEAVRELTHAFNYGNVASLTEVLSKHPGEFAAVIMEPVNFSWPEPGYLEEVRRITHEAGALLIFDEICSGFHFGLGGAQALFDVTPDLSTFGKALGNGWPISCVVGRSDVMALFDDVFMSFTFAGDSAAMCAALKTLDILENSDAYDVMAWAGRQISDGARAMAKELGLNDVFRLEGHPNWTKFSFVREDGSEDSYLRALWLQEVTRRGVLALTTFNMCAAHDARSVDKVLESFGHAFKYVAEVNSHGADAVYRALQGALPVPAFRVRT